MLQFVVNVACTGGIFMNICGHDPLRPLVVPTNSLTVNYWRCLNEPSVESRSWVVTNIPMVSLVLCVYFRILVIPII